MRGVFAKLNNPVANEAPTFKKDTIVAPADSDYQSTLIKLVSDSKMRLQELKRRASHETITTPLPSPLNVIEEESDVLQYDEPSSLTQTVKKRAPRPAVAK